MATIKQNMLIELIRISDLSFSILPFNQIDAFLFTMLAYMPFSSIMESDIKGLEISKEELNSKIETYVSPSLAKRKLNDIKCLKLVLHSKRYEEVAFSNYLKINDTTRELQFAAITFVLKNFIFVTYCGTDATTLGWKEDLNLMFGDVMPCQEEGIKYLNELALLYPDKKIMLGGHSKGGSIAVYAATEFMDKERILKVYSMDGPGYFRSFYQKDSFLKIKDRIIKYSPVSSIIGLLLTEEKNIQIINCYGKGIMQHDPYNWEIRNHEFVYGTAFDPKTYLIDQSLNAWVRQLSHDQRIVFVNSFYEVIKGMEIVEFRGMKYNIKMLAQAFTKFLPTWRKLPKENRKLMLKTLNVFIKCYLNERKKRYYLIY